MSQARLELSRPYPAWQGSAWTGRLRGHSGSVLVVRGPEGFDAARLADQEQRLSLTEVSHADMWLPRDVVSSRGRLCWVFDREEVLALGRAVDDSPGRLPLAAAVQATAHAAEILITAGSLAWQHPGPSADDLLIEPRGRLRLAGFLESGSTPASRRAPGHDTPQAAIHSEAALVFRLGLLLSTLATGVEPDHSSDESTHEASVRRALIRIMSRPGPVVTERFANWFRALRAFDPEERPPLAKLPDALRRVAEELRGVPLERWAAKHVARRLVTPSIDEVDDPITLTTMPSTSEEDRTDPSVGLRIGRVDDHTQETPLGRTPELLPTRPDPRGAADSAFGMPVRVGPPPEVLQKGRPALPAGFLDTVDEPAPEEEGVAAPGYTGPRGPGWYATFALVALSLALIASATLLLSYLFNPADPVKAPPRIGEVLGDPTGGTNVLIVHNPSGAALLVKCGEAETRTNGDAILPAAVSDCSVTAKLDGELVSKQVQVAGIVEVDCFDGEPSCELR